MIEGLRPYTDAVATGLEWLPTVPGHWETRRVKTVLQEVDRRTDAGEEKLLSLRMVAGLVGHNDAGGKPIPASALVGFKKIEPGQIVMNRMRAASGLFGVANEPGLVSPDYAVFSRLVEADQQYLLRLFKTPAMAAIFRSESKGLGTGQSGFLRLYTDRFGAIRIPFPPLDEQRLIVRFLDWHGAMTGKLIRAKRRLIALLNEQKQSIIHRAVTRGLNPAAKLKPSGVDWLGDVPEHWEVKRLKWIARNISEQANRCDDDDIYVALEDVESWSGRLLRVGPASVEGVILRRFERDDVLFGKLRPYLAKVVRPDRNGVCVGELLVLRADRAEVHPSFLETRLRAPDFITHVNSSTFGAKMPRADWSFIGGTAIAYPPTLSEQIQIVDAIAEEASGLENAIADVGNEITLIQEFRTRLIADVVTGQLDVRAVAANLADVGEADAADLTDDDDLDDDADDLIDEEEAA